MPNDKILKLVTSQNIADDLEKKVLASISSKVTDRYNNDLFTMRDYCNTAKQAIELASMQGWKIEKEGKSNVKTPIIARACINYASNMMPEFVKDSKVIKSVIYGTYNDDKVARAERVTKLLNYELLSPTSQWQESFEKMLVQLGCIGWQVRKTGWDDRRKSINDEFIHYTDVVFNANARSFDPVSGCRTVTHVLNNVSTNELVSYINSGLFIDLPDTYLDIPEGDLSEDITHTLYEQHCWLDLDKDGFEEPYIVTVHKESGYVLRIVARFELKDVEYDKKTKKKVVYIEPLQYFTLYTCFDSFDGSLLGLGLGTLLLSIAASYDTSINQLIDAGRLANSSTFLKNKSYNNKNKNMPLEIDKINEIETGGLDIDQMMTRVDFKEPSPTLFQLMGYLDQAAKELSSTGDMMTGQAAPSNMKTGAASALIERGLKVYNSMLKRVIKSFTLNVNNMFRIINIHYPNEKYKIFHDRDDISVQQDFDLTQLDVFPTADPNMAAESQRAMKAEALLAIKDDPLIPPENKINIIREFLTTIGYENLDRFVPSMETAQQDPMISQLKQEYEQKSAELQQQQQQLQQSQQQIQLQQQKLELEYQKMQMSHQHKVMDVSQKEQESVRDAQLETVKIINETQLKEKEIDARQRSKSGTTQ